MRRRRTWMAAALTLLGAVSVVGADELLELPGAAPAGSVVDVDEAVSGAWTCAVGDGRSGSELAVTAARPGADGDEPGTLDLRTFATDGGRAVGVPPVFPGAHVRATPSAGDASAVFGRWSDGPLTLAREWRLEEVDDVPRGTVAGPCHSSLADRWVIPGLSTEGGHEARLRAANPFPTDATIAIGFVTPQGPQEPLALQNLTVPAEGVFELTVNESMPEQADLTAVVRVLSGRAVAEGYQLARSAIGDVDGVSLLGASSTPAETWTVPWVSDREGDTSWLWVVNLGDRPAPVELTLHTPDGGVPPVGLSDVTVAPGQVRRVDLRGTFPEGVTAAAVTARSDGAPIHVSGAVLRSGDGAASTGFAVQLGIPAADDRWVVSGGATADRNERLDVVNPGSEPATFSVALFNGSTVLRPEELAELEVGPGQALSVPLREVLGAVNGWSAFVVASEGEVVVARVGTGGAEALHLVAHPATPSAAWRPNGQAVPATAAHGVVQRLGTAGGIGVAEPLGPDVEEEFEDPSAPVLDSDGDG
ncbi:DUF5719 family protein [Egicoccus sp. AB-alg6-2]|uniref:DUF5719 family protein n=1 Tax=Egicoccus sp. AB-alg6-2 TaxID=3242692 RepID=UPI00359EAFE5